METILRSWDVVKHQNAPFQGEQPLDMPQKYIQTQLEMALSCGQNLRSTQFVPFADHSQSATPGRVEDTKRSVSGGILKHSFNTIILFTQEA